MKNEMTLKDIEKIKDYALKKRLPLYECPKCGTKFYVFDEQYRKKVKKIYKELEKNWVAV